MSRYTNEIQTQTETDIGTEIEIETETLGTLEMFVTVACSSLKQLQLNDQRSTMNDLHMLIERVREIAAVSNCNRFRGISKNEFCTSHVGSHDGRKHFQN